jgi:hypothetical protein
VSNVERGVDESGEGGCIIDSFTVDNTAVNRRLKDVVVKETDSRGL